jgi:hypothetical protein
LVFFYFAASFDHQFHSMVCTQEASRLRSESCAHVLLDRLVVSNNNGYGAPAKGELLDDDVPSRPEDHAADDEENEAG